MVSTVATPAKAGDRERRRQLIWLLLVPAYFLGTFPSAVMIARSKGVDITKVGSGNPGASNIARTFGAKWGVLVFVLDGLKGFVPCSVALLLAGRYFHLRPTPAAYGMAVAAVLGHMYPITRRFKGGKGVATMGGACIALQPIIFVVLTAVWFAVRKLSGKASLASLMLTFGFPLGVFLLGGPGWEIATAGALGALVLLRHTENIKRLLTGRELSASRNQQPSE
jgi:glycerol-3-phosphate acyltransferase PlsY